MEYLGATKVKHGGLFLGTYPYCPSVGVTSPRDAKVFLSELILSFDIIMSYKTFADTVYDRIMLQKAEPIMTAIGEVTNQVFELQDGRLNHLPSSGSLSSCVSHLVFAILVVNIGIYRILNV